jgi:glycosyltransferase involved in cell wall biosynthesis
MNILILNWRDPENPKSGGAEIVTLIHAKAWSQAGHTVTWFSAQFPKCEKRTNLHGIEIVRSGGDISTYFHAVLFYFFSKKQFDLVIDQIHGLPYFTPLYVRRPKIAFIHEVAGEIWDYMYPFPINIVGKTLEKFSFTLYRSILFWTVSNSTKEELIQNGISATKIHILQNPLTNTVLSAEPKKEQYLTLLFVSRIVRMKGIEDVIKALFIIKKHNKHVSLWIIGEGESTYMNQLKKLIQKLNLEQQVQFFGKVSEKEKLSRMQRAHLLVHASKKEGWGLVVLESASQGTPAVVYNVAGLRDSVINNVTGIIVHENTPEVLAEMIIKLLQDKKLYHTLQQQGLDFAKSLTKEKAIEQSLQLLQAAVK